MDLRTTIKTNDYTCNICMDQKESFILGSCGCLIGCVDC